MNEPEKLHLSDVFNAAVAISVALAGGLIAWLSAWIKGRRVRMQKRLEDMDKLIADAHKEITRHAELLAVSEANMSNIKNNLAELKKQTDIQTGLLYKILGREN